MLPLLLSSFAILTPTINALHSPPFNSGLLNVSQRHPPGCEGTYYGWANPSRVAACKEAFGLLDRLYTANDEPQRFGPKGIGGDDSVLPWRFSSCEFLTTI